MGKEYNISRPAGSCRACETAFAPEQEFMATVREDGEELRREDYCLDCWAACDSQDDPARLGVWKTRMPRPQEKKKLFVDDEVLVNFFQRLAGADDEAKVAFRYVLALVLLRKKVLVYESAHQRDDGREVWLMRMKGSQERHEVIDPKMDEEQIQQVSEQLGQVLEGEL